MDRELEQLLKEMTTELKDLTRFLRGSTRSVIQGTKSIKQETTARKMAIAELQKQKKDLKERGELTKELNQEIDDSIDSLEKFQKKAKAGAGVMGFFIGAIKGAIDAVVSLTTAGVKTAVAFSDTTRNISNLEDAVAAGIEDIPLLGVASKELAREIDSNVEAFSQLAKTGATFGSSIVMLRRAAGDATLPLGKFTDLIGTNSGLLAKLFGSVDQGIPQIVGLTTRLRDITENEFAKFGLTLDDTSGFLTTFLELERARGNVTQMTQAQLLAGTREYTKNLVTLSKLTGQSVDELNEQNKAMAADGVFQSQLTKMAAGDAELLSASIASLPPGLKQLAKEVIGLGAPISETSRELTAISDGRFNRAIQQFQQDLDPVAFSNLIKTISADVMQNGEAFGQAALVSGQFTGALNDIVQSIGREIDPSVVQTELDAVGDNIKNLRNITSSLDRVAAKLQIDRLEALAPALYNNSEDVVKFTKGFNDRLKLLTEPDGGLDKFYKMLERGVDYFTTGEAGQDVKDATDKVNNTVIEYLNKTLKGFGSDTKVGDLPTISPFQANNGTNGFMDFGAGTPAVLHGVEAVVPKNDIGQLAGLLAEVGATTTNNTAGDVINNTSSVDMATLNSNTTELIQLNKKVADHLNTLVTIGAMTEKNTKATTNSLANMGGSLV
jgi:hypothetical protein